MTNIKITWEPGDPRDRSVLGFRIRHGGSRAPMSKTKYFAMRDAGQGPAETIVGGRITIEPEAEAEWVRRHTRPTGAAARLAQREAAARSEKARHAAMAARLKAQAEA
jgi:hypothetical protein